MKTNKYGFTKYTIIEKIKANYDVVMVILAAVVITVIMAIK